MRCMLVYGDWDCFNVGMYVCRISIRDFNLLKLPSFYIEVEDPLPVLENEVTKLAKVRAKHSTRAMDAML